MRKTSLVLAILFLAGMLSGCGIFAGEADVRGIRENYYETYVQDPDYDAEDIFVDIVYTEDDFCVLNLSAESPSLFVRWNPTERVCGYDFEYAPGSILLVYCGERFSCLRYAERKGILSEEDVKIVHARYLTQMKSNKGGGQ